ncbi:HAMP domain-containing protein [Anaerobacillus sp. CMMVII]|uniref:sensor histidine kinase n=1 Tax=Anaerobacillus sp. CMMVII TaxID=2755588 RepID=UPI0021B78297|nr:HAMP domain-containing sensor histidine kinase [Anaerobacillus sp. CMMVII]MCT8139306.1 HAMP domain-containing protein [Anaerobacillus sp. CMMVII]
MKKGITLKIFTITSALLVVSALIIYLTLYFLLPTYYYSYKKSNLNDGVANLIERIAVSRIEEVEFHFNDFVESYNVRLIVQNEFGYVIYFPMDRFFHDSKGRNGLPGRNSVNRRLLEDNWNNPNLITIVEPIKFRQDPNEYVLTVSAPLQPIDEASDVILMFFPYMLIIIGVISVIGGYVYSNLLSKPLLTLNKTAKKMADLDFSTKSTIHTNDELGELSRSLNKLAINLQNSMDELTEANAQLKDDIQKERDQEQKRSEFIATISHELKTPLTAVSGQIEGMIHGIGSFKDREKYLKQSYTILKDMEKLVQEILDVSQLESSYFSPQIQKINLSRLVNQTFDGFQFFSEQKQLDVQLSIEPDVFTFGDAKLITRAVANVFSNALKYTDNGKQIKLSLFTDVEGPHLTIMNACAFIEEDELGKIFEPFYRIEKSRNRKTGGSGLGLYIVKKIFDLHNINYSIENVTDGVLFTINFKTT